MKERICQFCPQFYFQHLKKVPASWQERKKEITIKDELGQYWTGTTTVLSPFTRDTFSSCIKATYCEIDGKPYPIFKNPKEGGFKTSQKGCCVVYEDLSFADGFTWKEASENKDNQFITIFKDGKMIKEQELQEIRNRLHGGKF